MSPTPPDSGQTQGLLTDASTYGGLGALAILARWLISPNKPGWVKLVCGMGAASITAIFVGFAADATIESVKLRWAVVGGLSYATPEVLTYVLAYVRKYGEKLSG